jgi:hypothetical protein
MFSVSGFALPLFTGLFSNSNIEVRQDLADNCSHNMKYGWLHDAEQDVRADRNFRFYDC